MEETIIDINGPNIVTITIMALIGFAVLGLVGKGIAKMRKAGSDA